MHKINKTAVAFLRRYATLLENQTCFVSCKNKTSQARRLGWFESV
ncbi:hypothetical protein FAEPRAM212_02527 [Faecalibacterium prausnitzii M21/2]|uniref:Uncharacterized protein n=1 Tax=Faecalibacterium prausnitzii M21/2 TaxID=411485 RepID=A8SER5_9FIRM|nr:hypothetical protein FAEPRAM212_02527 [Faecalibacterium prausnitzii M21/2]